MDSSIPLKPFSRFSISIPLKPFSRVSISIRRFLTPSSSSPFKTVSFYPIKKPKSFQISCKSDGPVRSPENDEYFRSGGIGMAILGSAPPLGKVGSGISPFLATLAANPTFVSGLLAWVAAQSVKMFLSFLVERKWDFRVLFSSGGMPSSHSALCMALTTSVAFRHGAADSLFPVCLGFSLIVMYDAIGVRRHAGMHAEILNKIVEDLFQGHPISQRKLKVLLGHTPSQVIGGALLGILVACICCQGFMVAA